jgi:hypothetical protein
MGNSHLMSFDSEHFPAKSSHTSTIPIVSRQQYIRGNCIVWPRNNLDVHKFLRCRRRIFSFLIPTIGINENHYNSTHLKNGIVFSSPPPDAESDRELSSLSVMLRFDEVVVMVPSACRFSMICSLLVCGFLVDREDIAARRLMAGHLPSQSRKLRP